MNLIHLIPNLYNQYLMDIEREKQADSDPNKLRMSSAYGCFLKNQYRRKGVKEELDVKSRRNMRTGTLIGDDMETAVELNREELEKHGKLLIQEEVSLHDGAVVGHLDIAYYHYDTGLLEVIDEKTINDWGWKYVFGKDAYDKKGYIFQLVSYAHGIMEKYSELEVKSILLHNLYWRKGDAELKELFIDYKKYKNEALLYWDDAIQMQTEILKAGDTYGCPMASWECGYCAYSWQCPSPYKKKKK